MTTAPLLDHFLELRRRNILLGVSEYLAGSQGGLGWLAVSSLNSLRVARLFAVIVLLCALGIVVYAAVSTLRRWLVPWHASAVERPPGL